VKSECPHCGYELEVLDKLAGRRVKCPRCGERFRAERREPAPAGGPGAPPPTKVPSTSGRWLSRDVGIVVLGVLAVCTIAGALVLRIYLDHQSRVQQRTLREEAKAEAAAADNLFRRGKYTEARALYLEAQDLLNQLEVRDKRLAEQIEQRLNSEQIKYLAQGMVKFRGEWIAAKEKEAIEAREKGLVEFDGRWVTPQEKTRLEAEREEAEQAARLAQEEASVRAEAVERGPEVVKAFLQYAKEFAPAEAAERYMSKLTDEPLGFPPIVFDYKVDEQTAYVARDDQRKHPDVSATYCGVKAYVTTSEAGGSRRVVWNFRVHKVGSEWKITFAQQKAGPRLGE